MGERAAEGEGANGVGFRGWPMVLGLVVGALPPEGERAPVSFSANQGLRFGVEGFSG